MSAAILRLKPTERRLETAEVVSLDGELAVLRTMIQGYFQVLNIQLEKCVALKQSQNRAKAP